MEQLPTARRILLGRLLPVGLVAALSGSSGLLLVRERAARDEASEARDAVAAAHRATDDAVAAERRKLEAARSELAAATQSLEAARRSGDAHASELARAGAEREDARKKAAALADRLGEVEAERDRLKQHADELDTLMKALETRKLNVRRLAGLEGPPRQEVEVLSVDDKRTPPVLILRADTLEGFEEGDALYVVRPAASGGVHTTGRATVERVDHERGLLRAVIAKLDSGEKVSIGDKLTTYVP
jgi:predicted RNase H-like nuclease (RuvC/YqgF family)